MQHEVLKQFPWSSNGYDVEILNPGDKRDFGAALVGLAREGFILDDAVGPAPEPVADLMVEPPVDVVPEVKAPEVEPVVEEPEAAPTVEPVAEPVAEPAPHPLDHDGNGKLGGSKPRGKRR